MGPYIRFRSRDLLTNIFILGLRSILCSGQLYDFGFPTGSGGDPGFFGGNSIEDFQSAPPAVPPPFRIGNRNGNARNPGRGRTSGANLQQDFLKLFDFNTPMRSRGPYGYEPLYGNSRTSCPVHDDDIQLMSSMCSKDDFFYGMNPKHMTAVGMMKSVMMAARTAEEVVCKAGYLRESPSINHQVWLRGLIGAQLSRGDMRGLHRPSLVEIMPAMMINSVVLEEARRLSSSPGSSRGDGCVVVDGSVGRDNGIENVLWYWREDVMTNAHHWYWHLANPFNPMQISNPPPPRPDRRGELFYYTHHSMLARYHSERLSNGFGKVVPLKIEVGTVIEDAYYPHLDESNSGRPWTSRPPFAVVQDILDRRDPNNTIVSNIVDRLDRQARIADAINSGAFVTPDGQLLPINNRQGIDFVGEVVEAGIYSVNPDLYGDLGVHNEGHLIFGLVQDPQGELGLPPGVMADPATAMRDPIFYRYHSVPIESFFDKHKHNLEPYTPSGGELPLIWPGVKINAASVVSRSVNTGRRRLNDLSTFWNHVTYNLARGLDFNRTADQPINVCLRHLDHDPFEYHIELELDRFVKSNLATVRIFMAPHYDENGRPYTMFEQRYVFFALDSFTVRVVPGKNLILRSSYDSTLTVPWPQRLEELQRDNNNQMPYCGCGWPHHLLLPKGSTEGMIFDIFVMVTDGVEDAVPQLPRPPGNVCEPAPIYCGIQDQLYPDSRPMGYPFDRLPYSIQELRTNSYGERVRGRPRMVRNLAEYINGIPNTGVFQVRVSHSGL